MEVTFAGVGEACDPRHPNTSILIHDTRRRHQFLFDCGFTVPHAYFAMEPDPNALDLLWISHFHGDHFFGVPLLLLRLWEDGRKKPLFLLGPAGVESMILKALDMAFGAFAGRISFPLQFAELGPGEERQWEGFSFKAEENVH